MAREKGPAEAEESSAGSSEDVITCMLGTNNFLYGRERIIGQSREVSTASLQ